MFCCNCGKQLPDKSQFCFYCGKEQPAYTPRAAAPAPAPVVVEEPKPVFVPTPVVEEPAPVVVPTPVVEEPAPVVVPEPVVEEPAPVVVPEPVVEEPAPVVVPTPVVAAPAAAPARPEPMPAEPKKKKKEKKARKEKKASNKSSRGGVVVLIILCAILAILTTVVGIKYVETMKAAPAPETAAPVEMPMVEAAPEVAAPEEAVEEIAPNIALPAPDFFMWVSDASECDVTTRDYTYRINGDPSVYPSIYLEIVCSYGMEILSQEATADHWETVVGIGEEVYATFGWDGPTGDVFFHFEDFVELKPTEACPEQPPIVPNAVDGIRPDFHEVVSFLDMPQVIGMEPITPIDNCWAEAYDLSYLEDGFARAMGYAQVLAEDPNMPMTLEYYEAWDIADASLHVFSFRAKEGFDVPDAGFVFDRGEEDTVSPCGAMVVMVEERFDGGVIIHVAYSTDFVPVDMGTRYDPNSENPYLQ